MMKSRFHSMALVIASLFLLAGCGWLAVTQPEGFDQRLAYAYGTHTAVLDAAAVALGFGEITVTEAEDIAALADRSRTILDTAKTVADAGDVDTAERKLLLATELLIQLQNHLRRRE